MELVPNKSSKEDEEETKLQKIKKIVGKPRPSEKSGGVSSDEVKKEDQNDNLTELRGD